jgi:two-component system LytT family sensor kinase
MAKTTSKDRKGYRKFAKLPLVLILCYFLMFFFVPTMRWNEYFHRELRLVVIELVFNILLCSTLIIVSLWSAKILDRWLSWEFHPRARFLSQLLVQILAAGIIFVIFLALTMEIFGGNFSLENLKSVQIRKGFRIYIMLSILISFTYTGTIFFQNWKRLTDEANALRLKAEHLKQLTLKAELEALKMQLDPHFMFNNFSTLSALIREDQSQAQLFLDKLSKVYRYMIVNIPKNTVTLQEEMELANAYFYLMKIRLGDNIRMDVTLDPELMHKGIPPITIQLLIENALKHNIASSKRPLIITIKGDGNGNLLLINSLQRINYTIPSTSMGLQNITSRYKLLTDKEPIINETDKEFIVLIPLIDF